MPTIFSEEVLIKANIEEVWEYFVDLEKYGARWLPGVSKVEVSPDGMMKEKSIIKQFIRGKAHISTVTEFLKFSQVTFTAIHGNMHVNYTYTFLNKGDSTLLSLIAKVEAKGFSKIMLPIIKKVVKSNESGQLARLQESYTYNLISFPLKM